MQLLNIAKFFGRKKGQKLFFDVFQRQQWVNKNARTDQFSIFSFVTVYSKGVLKVDIVS
jgi:hypothetical protein